MVVVLYKFGVLAGLTAWSAMNLASHPLTFDTDAFYFPSSAIALAIILGLLLWGFVASTSHRSPHTSAFPSSDSL